MATTRLAPSPTGALHLGNARTFLINWLLSKKQGWRTILRIEDLDGPRIKVGTDESAMADLAWLGLEWDGPPIYQSARKPKYEAAVKRLLDRHMAYPCICTRSEIEAAASAPHADDGSTRYPGTCRGRFHSIDEAREQAGRPPAIRFAVSEETVDFVDGFSGSQHFLPSEELGDFAIAKADGTPAYQLAVVVDDAEMGVDWVVRGDDLLDSTPRQILLYRALGMADRIPNYVHLPLVVGVDGHRLAKRHGDTRIVTYRDLGISSRRMIALLGRWCGIEAPPEGIDAVDLIDSFRLDRVPTEPIVFSAADDAWLRGAGTAGGC